MSKAKYTKFGSSLAWIDLLYSQNAVFVFLMVAAFVLINPPAKTNAVEMKAEFIVTMDWPSDSYDDIDVHMLLPDGQRVWFRDKEKGYVLLDHDDIGVNNVFLGADGKVQRVKEHRETVSVRAVVPGTYTVNVFVYRTNPEHLGERNPQTLPFPVTVTLTKLNPRVTELAKVQVEVDRLGQQKTAFAFTVKEDGTATVDRDADRPFVELTPIQPFVPNRPLDTGER